jgi:hypothetical protein
MLTYLKGDSHANYGVNLLLYQVQSHELKGIVPWELKVFTAVNMNNATFEYFFLEGHAHENLESNFVYLNSIVSWIKGIVSWEKHT